MNSRQSSKEWAAFTQQDTKLYTIQQPTVTDSDPYQEEFGAFSQRHRQRLSTRPHSSWSHYHSFLLLSNLKSRSKSLESHDTFTCVPRLTHHRRSLASVLSLASIRSTLQRTFFPPAISMFE